MNRPVFDPAQESRPVDSDEDDWRDFARPQERRNTNENSPRVHLCRETLLRVARRAYIDRRKRIVFFGSWLFGEPAWDILLVLYIESDLQRCTISRLSEFTGAAMTTILRWLEALEKRGLVRRTEHPTDRRSVFIELTGKGEDALNSYFSETHTQPR